MKASTISLTVLVRKRKKENTDLVGEEEIEAEKVTLEVEDREAGLTKKEENNGLKKRNVKKAANTDDGARMRFGREVESMSGDKKQADSGNENVNKDPKVRSQNETEIKRGQIKENKAKAVELKKKVSRRRQEEVNTEAFNVDDEEGLDRQYNEGVLRRDGSPNVSDKLGAPSTPIKPKNTRKLSKTKSTEALKRKNISGLIRARPRPVAAAKYVRFSMGGMILKSEQGKITYTKDILKNESGMKILDKATTELAGSFKCAFWPGCVGTVNMKGKMVRGGTVVEPADHPKQGTIVYICDEHDESEIETEGEEEEQQLESLGSDTSYDGDLSGKGSSSNTIDDIDDAVVEKNEGEEDQDMFAEDLMSQSLLSRGGPK